MLPALGSPIFAVLTFVAGLVMLRLNLWRAWLTLNPASMRLVVEDPGPVSQLPHSLEATHDALLALGFVSLGTHLEHPRFGLATLMYDYAHAHDGVFASLFEAPRWGVRWGRGLAYVPRSESEGPAARLVLTSPMANGGFVVSANARRPGANVPGRYLSGAIEGVSADRLFKAHLRRLPQLGTPQAEWTIDGRLHAAKTWHCEVGKTELRQQHAVGLLWTLGALGMVGASFLGNTGPTP